jgi:protein gp37
MADVMDDEAPKGEREKLWNLIDQTPNLIWQLLTKRPHRYERYLPKEFKHNNVWYGTTAENQEFYDVRFPIVCELAIQRGGVCWISYEPAIGPLSIIRSPLSGFYYNIPPDWVIFGGESGHGRRPMEQKWLENLRAECDERDVALFVKQFSAFTPDQGKKLIPAELLIQEFPDAV